MTAGDFPTSREASRRRARRLRVIQVSVLALVVLAGNAPFLGAWASDQYDVWRSHQQSYMQENGRWDIVADSGSRTIHAALLRSGKVLLMAGSGNNQANFDAKRFETLLWDPVANTFESIYTPWDVFCAGQSFLPDGELLVAGGTKKYEVLAQDSPDGKKHEYQGLKDSYVFDPDTEEYVKVPALNYARWYPTLVTLGDGRVVAVSGLDEHGDIDPGNTEWFGPTTTPPVNGVYNTSPEAVAQSTWHANPGLVKEFPTYPSLLLAADGRLFFSGASAGYGPTSAEARQSGFWDLANGAFQAVQGLESPEINETAGTVLLPPAQDQRVMFVAGGGIGDTQVATSRTAIVDLDSPNPVWEAGPDLAVAKRYPGVVILPDDTVLISGGSERYRAQDTLTTEIFDPATNTLRSVAHPWVGRDYHSEYLLLPDGRVAVFGSNPLSDANTFETQIEIYTPPYLYQGGERPAVTTAPENITLGSTIDLGVSQEVSKVRLIRPGAYTHVTDTELRSVALDVVAQAQGEVRVSVPGNPNLLLPGWYMLFVTNADGIPSVAKWVHVG